MSTEEVINVSKEDGYSDRQVVTVHPNLLALASAYTPGSEAEKALVRKIDRRIVPCIWILYTLVACPINRLGHSTLMTE
jgi:hypothetical protein